MKMMGIIKSETEKNPKGNEKFSSIKNWFFLSPNFLHFPFILDPRITTVIFILLQFYDFLNMFAKCWGRLGGNMKMNEWDD